MKIRFLGAGDRLEGPRSFFVGSEVLWEDGPGAAELEIEVGVGEVTIRLE